MRRWSTIDILIAPLLLMGAIILALWLIFVRTYDMLGDVYDYLVGRHKPCDKEPAKRRPRRAF